MEKQNFAKQLSQDVTDVLTKPSEFFTTRFQQMSFNQALAVGIASSWVAALLEWLTRILKHESLMDSFKKLKHQLEGLPIWKDLPEDMWAQSSLQPNTFFPHWMLEGMKIMLTPFQSLISIIIYGTIFYLGALLLVDRSNSARPSVTINETIKITAVTYASTLVGAILGFLPLALGSFLGWVYLIVLLTIGFAVRFNISRLRAVFLVFLPSLSAIMIMGCVIGVLFALFGLIVSSLFHG